MSNTVTIPSHCMVTIRRPNGDLETIDYTAASKGQVKTITPKLLATVNKAMAQANRGQIISYENVTKEVDAPKPTAADIAEERYIKSHNAILRASAGGEPCDQINGIADGDNTPAHKLDN